MRFLKAYLSNWSFKSVSEVWGVILLAFSTLGILEFMLLLAVPCKFLLKNCSALTSYMTYVSLYKCIILWLVLRAPWRDACRRSSQSWAARAEIYRFSKLTTYRHPLLEQSDSKNRGRRTCACVARQTRRHRFAIIFSYIPIMGSTFLARRCLACRAQRGPLGGLPSNFKKNILVFSSLSCLRLALSPYRLGQMGALRGWPTFAT